jgi:hypothetical protein
MQVHGSSSSSGGGGGGRGDGSSAVVCGSSIDVHGSSVPAHWTALQVAYGRSCLVVFVCLPTQGLLTQLQGAAGRQRHVSVLASMQYNILS